MVKLYTRILLYTHRYSILQSVKRAACGFSTRFVRFSVHTYDCISVLPATTMKANSSSGGGGASKYTLDKCNYCRMPVGPPVFSIYVAAAAVLYNIVNSGNAVQHNIHILYIHIRYKCE